MVFPTIYFITKAKMKNTILTKIKSFCCFFNVNNRQKVLFFLGGFSQLKGLIYKKIRTNEFMVMVLVNQFW